MIACGAGAVKAPQQVDTDGAIWYNGADGTESGVAPGKLFDAGRAARFDGPGRLILAAGEEMVLESQ